MPERGDRGPKGGGSGDPCKACTAATASLRLYCRARLRALFRGVRVSNQDSHFVNTFSLVIGLLVLIAIGLFALARIVAAETQDRDVYEEQDYTRSVDARVKPAAREAIAGQDNSGLAIQPDNPNATAGALPIPKSGAEVYQQVCSSCHGAGLVGAPKAGDAAAWGPRIAKGTTTLYDHALHGFSGSAGTMPAKGNRPDLPDDIVKAGVDYMVQMARH